MRVIKPATLNGYAARHRDARRPLAEWLALAQAAQWRSLEDVRRVAPKADAVVLPSGRTITVFNIKGNHYRLITAIHYNTGIIFIRDLMTHAEYDKGRWKEHH